MNRNHHILEDILLVSILSFLAIYVIIIDIRLFYFIIYIILGICIPFALLMLYIKPLNRSYYRRLEKIPTFNVKKERFCFICKKYLNIYEFYSVNKDLTKQEIEELWESDYIQFLCCNCKSTFGKLIQSNPDLLEDD